MKFKHRSANNVEGILLRPYGGPAIFRIYKENGEFIDYEILHDDVGVKILDESAELIESLDGSAAYLDYTADVLGQGTKYDRKNRSD